jgi:AcrR family transcriptional regulator
MNARTVDWTAGTGRAEGLRERKKRETRQRLTDTATEMFLARGFDAVRVVEIADACGVSEKTVFNYFPSKEALLLDHPDTTMAALRTALADPDRTPTESALRVLGDELGALTAWLAAQPDLAVAGDRMRRFRALIDSTPALRAYQRDQTEALVDATARALADRAGFAKDDPEPRIAAIALIGLWQVQFGALRKHLDGTRTPARTRQAVTAEVRRAARLIDNGLATFRAKTARRRGAGGAGSAGGR